jgi:hypothetical protein
VDAVPYARWIWLWWGLTSPFGFLYTILIAQKRRRFLFFHSIGYPFVIGGLFLLFIPRYGLWGAVYANVCAGTCLLIYHISAFRYYLARERLL